jgi:serine/threonine-protein kinase
VSCDPTQTTVDDGGARARGDLLPGALAGAWRIEVAPARGGFGAVYRARHATDGRPAAVKLLLPFLLGSEDARERFAREIEVLRRVEHPNVVRLLDAGSLADGRPYYVMDWIDGPTLDRRIGGTGLPLDEVVRIMDGVCAGLGAVHAAGLLHRDLKAQNVLLAPGPAPASVRLCDFGIAKLLDDEAHSAQLTASGLRVGTPSAMAPEQITGAAIGPATDVYALGVLLYQMLTGRLPFDAETAVEMQSRHLDEAPPLASLLVRVPAAVDDVIIRSLEKQAARRFAGARELAEALHAAARSAAPARPVRSSETPAIALYVRGGADGSLADVRREMLNAGFQVVREWVDAGFFAAVLAEGAAEDRAQRESAIRLAEALAHAHPERRVRVHVASAKTLTVAGATRIVGGDLLALDRWPGAGVPGEEADPLVISQDVRRGMTRA